MGLSQIDLQEWNLSSAGSTFSIFPSFSFFFVAVAKEFEEFEEFEEEERSEVRGAVQAPNTADRTSRRIERFRNLTNERPSDHLTK